MGQTQAEIIIFLNCLVKRGQSCKGFLLHLNKIQSFAMVSKVLHYQDYATLSNFIHALCTLLPTL